MLPSLLKLHGWSGVAAALLATPLLMAGLVHSAELDYVIVTSTELAPEFQRLADARADQGLATDVRTIGWIDANYPDGVDAAERVRLFIRDAHQHSGLTWVLLGGDAEVVPVRHAHTMLGGGTFILTDYYFMCLDGNWNADADSLWGEGMRTVEDPGDNADLFPEVFAGRAPVSTIDEARAFVDHTLAYESLEQGLENGYPTSALFLADVFGAPRAEGVAAAIPPWFKRVRLYEDSGSYPGALALTREAAIDSLENGFGFVYYSVLPALDATIWALVPGDTLTTSDIDDLTNAPRLPIVFDASSSVAAFDEDDALGERWVTSQNGAGVAFVGWTAVAFVSPSTLVQNEFFDLVLDDQAHIGQATAEARLPIVAGAAFDNAARWATMSFQLLGDPLVRVRLEPSTVGLQGSAVAEAAPPRLSSVAPNPFNPSISIEFDVGRAGGSVRLSVFDATGRLIRTLVDAHLRAGSHRSHWDGATADARRAPSGTYLVRLDVDGQMSTRKVTLAR